MPPPLMLLLRLFLGSERSRCIARRAAFFNDVPWPIPYTHTHTHTSVVVHARVFTRQLPRTVFRVACNALRETSKRPAEYYDGRICTHVRSHASEESHARTSPDFLYCTCCPWYVARSFSGSVAICYVLPILWMASCFHIMDRYSRGRRCPQQRHCRLIHWLMFLLHGIDCEAKSVMHRFLVMPHASGREH